MANASDPTPNSPSNLQAMLARLRGAAPAAATETKAEPARAAVSAKPAAAPQAAAVPPAPTAAKPAAATQAAARPVAASPPAAAATPKPAAPQAAARPPAPAAAPAASATLAGGGNGGASAANSTPATAVAASPSEAPAVCPFCRAPRGDNVEFCDSCGAYFSAAGSAGASVGTSVVKGRYHITELISERNGVSRFRALDHGSGGTPVSVILLREGAGEAVPAAEVIEEKPDGEAVPAADAPTGPPWPSVAWEKGVLEKAAGPHLPRILDSFTEDGFDYLVEEIPAGMSLWEAWDEPEHTIEQKFTWLKEAAEGLHQLHKAGALLEFIKPDMVTINAEGKAVLNNLADILPLPLSPNVLLKGTMYTAPELILNPAEATARANLFSFGAMIYSLHVGRELTEMDFEKSPQGQPKPFIPRFPDSHPALARLITKTFARDLWLRFPTDEAGKKDPTGFTELIATLDACRKSLGKIRMEIAAWTTIGIVRTGNEDACALLHSCETTPDDIHEYSLLLLCDGMGGYEAGEIAAALAIQTMRKECLKHRFFSHLATGEPPAAGSFNVQECKKVLYDAVKEANRVVFEAPKSGIGRRGMGCTAEAVYVDGQNVVVAHVGDSRVYHLSGGHLKQVTRDQTLVNRLVELGQITKEEAENHPRKNELQQAVGGRKDVEPDTYSVKVKPGDWVLVCSDGLTGHVKDDELQEMLLMEAYSADTAARRLVNLTNMRGATDNTTVVVIRAT